MKSLGVKCMLSAIIILGFAVPAFAASGENSGTVASIYEIGTGNMNFQVTINGLGTLCPGHNFAYISNNDNNYNVEEGAIELAHKYGSTLYIFWTTDVYGYCHITRLYW